MKSGAPTGKNHGNAVHLMAVMFHQQVRETLQEGFHVQSGKIGATMTTLPHEFPILRRTADGRHLYRIDGMERFTELQRIGKQWVLHEVKADAYPEKVRIMEMIHGDDGRYIPLEEGEWDAVFRTIERV